MILPLMNANGARQAVGQSARAHWSRRAIATWHLCGALLLTALGVWVRSADWLDIWNIFRRDEEASHVILAPLVVAILIWVRRERLRRIRLRTSWFGPIVVVAGCLVAYFGDDHGYQSLRHLGAVTIVVGCLLTMLGRELLINFAPAFLAFLFLIPMPPLFRQKISLPLESVNAHITEDLLNVFGIPATRSGNQLFVNGRAISIVEACNGLRGFFTLVMVAYLVAFVVSLRFYVRVLLVALSPVAAIICNVIRLVLTVCIYGYMSGEAGDAFHAMSGWVMLPLAFAMLYGIVGALRWALVPVSPFTLARD